MSMTPKIFMAAFRRAIEPLRSRVMLLVNRAAIDSVDDKKLVQTMKLKVLAGETKEKVPSIQHFGFSSHPPIGSDAVMISVNGNRENSVIIGTEHRDSRYVDLDEGDSVMYNKEGIFLLLKKANLEGFVSKIIVKNDDHEFVSLLSEYMETVNKEFVLTALGPQTWVPASKVLLDEVKEKFDTFKE